MSESAPQSDKHVITWAMIDSLSLSLAERLPTACATPVFDRIVAVARGGLAPASLLATHLGIRRVESVQVRLYDGATQLETPQLLGDMPTPYGPSGDASRTLIVDEIVDSGTTFRYLAGLFPEAHMAALVVRRGPTAVEEAHGLVACHCDPEGAAKRTVWVGREVNTERWILFPWSPVEEGAQGS